MPRLIRRALAAALVATLWPVAATALSFKVIENDGFDNKILLIYDCGRIKEQRACTPENRRFHPSDGTTLSSYWRQGPFEEVWLLSGGGAVVAGLALAKDFRDHGQAVRVPGVARLLKAKIEPTRDPACVSSCTVAFMGGQFRAIDEGATYQVHSASYVAWFDVEESRPSINRAVAFREKNGFRALLNGFTDDARQSARDLFTLFQDTLWLPLKPRNARDAEWQRRENAFNSWMRERQGQVLPYSAEQQARDEEVFALEGPAALQDIIMRAERDEAARAVREIRSFLPQLGRRADAALAMLEAMFETSSILETYSMPRETLLRMGYVTEFVK